MITCNYEELQRLDMSQSDLAHDLAKKFPYVSDVNTVAGDDDILMKIRGKDITTVNKIAEQLRKVDSVLRTKTIFVMEEVKKAMIRGKLPEIQKAY